MCPGRSEAKSPGARPPIFFVTEYSRGSYLLTASAIQSIERGTEAIREKGRLPHELPSQIDRSFQRSLLLWMRDKYPSMAYKVPTSLDGNDRRFYFILFYLKEHGLCEALAEKNLDGSISWGGAKITAKGL